MENAAPARCPKCHAEMDGEGIGCPRCILELALELPEDGDDVEAMNGDGFPRIGGYAMLGKVGEGGFGEVYLARRFVPEGREVAVKVLKPGMDSRDVLRRFDAERRVLAKMDHPGIAPVVEAGITEEGRPFFAMEYVDGLPITEYCARRELGIRARLGIFIKVCEAIQHAHQKGVIHRDIKPSNVLVPLDGDAGAVKVIDFGIAKAIGGDDVTEATFHTIFGGHRGTPGYMSPEQVGLEAEDADTRSDVYGLGILLYELLTGTVPFLPKKAGVAGVDELRRMIREHDATPPSARAEKNGTRWVATLRGDLDAITLKALEKDRERRYESAVAMAQDVRAWLEHRPVIARRPGALDVAWKFVRRHRLWVSVAAAMLLVISGASIVSTSAAIRARRAEADARKSETMARTEAEKSHQAAMFLATVFLGVNPSDAKGKDTTLLRSILDSTSERIGIELKSSPDLEAYLRSCIGWAYHRIGEQARAEEHLRQSARLYRNLAGQELRLAITLNWLGYAVLPRDLDAAAISAREAYERMTALMENPATTDYELRILADTTPCHARILMSKGQHLEAAAILETFKDFQIRMVGPDGRRVAASYSTMGQNALQRRDLPDRLATAEEYFRKAHDIHARVWGTNTAEAASIRGNLGRVMLDRGRGAEAEPLLRQNLADLTAIYGEGHPELFLPMLRLAEAQIATVQWDEAEQTLRRAQPLRSRSAAHRVRQFDSRIRSMADHFEKQGDIPRAAAIKVMISGD